MPLIRLETSCDLSHPGKRQSLTKALSKLASEGIGKPERYVMAVIHDGLSMTMSGESGPCALVTIRSIGGLTQAVNQTLATRIDQMLQEELAISQDRIYILFEDIPPTHWAFNGRTFG